MDKQNKRARTTSFSHQYFRLGKDLSSWLSNGTGAQKHVHEKELSRSVLFAYLKQRGELVGVDLIDVEVQKLDGSSFAVTMDTARNQISVLKSLIQSQSGIPVSRQELYCLEDKRNKTEKGPKLKDAELIMANCSVVLSISPKQGHLHVFHAF
jgi:hypothetical protein